MAVIRAKGFDYNILDEISEAFDVVSKICNTKENDEITLDLTRIGRFAPSFCGLFLTLEKPQRLIHLECMKEMVMMEFPYGIRTGNMRLSEFKAFMQVFSRSQYIPLIQFPAKPSEEGTMNEILSVVEEILIAQIGGIANVASGLRYIIGECVDNISQHSKSEIGYISAATNRLDKYVDLCIADHGITLLGSYRENGDVDIASDIEAMMASNRGISTKNLPNAENRGFGIITSRNMLTTGLKGIFIMISGKAMLIKSERCNQYVDLPNGVYCKGTVGIYRIPYVNEEFNYINFIE